jgi:hypothetical protein
VHLRNEQEGWAVVAAAAAAAVVVVLAACEKLSDSQKVERLTDVEKRVR